MTREDYIQDRLGCLEDVFQKWLNNEDAKEALSILDEMLDYRPDNEKGK